MTKRFHIMAGLALFLLSACGGSSRNASCLQTTGCGGGSTTPLSGIQNLNPVLQSDFTLVSGIVLGAEYGGGDTVARWTSSPTLSIFNATAQQRQYVTQAIAQINYAIRYSPIQISVVADNDPNAAISLAFGTASQLPQIASYFDVPYVQGNSGFFWTTSDGQDRLADGVVLIQSDVSSSTILRHTILEELTQVMGPMRDQALYPNSVFYEKNGVSGQVVQLSALDARLLAFLYMYLEPGDRYEDVLQKFMAVWKTPIS